MRFFFNGSDEESLIQEVGIIAERWHWSHESIMGLPTLVRRRYLEEISELYEKEKEAMNKK